MCLGGVSAWLEIERRSARGDWGRLILSLSQANRRDCADRFRNKRTVKEFP
jgi:hypothetical protein